MQTSTNANIDVAAVASSEASRSDCLKAILRMTSLRPTRQRLYLADRMIGRDRHVTAEALYAEACAAGEEISLATVYNTLRQFQSSGLVRELAREGTRSVFDTNTSAHHHFYLVDDQRVIDIPSSSVRISGLPEIMPGYELDDIQVLVRIRRKENPA
jgi:Fur family iron response transcriptional regulator